MKQNNLLIGKIGENIARDFLKRMRFKILETNFRTPFGEIDLIALDKKTLVFVEVKTRTSKEFGHPYSAITYFKKKSIIKNALHYLYTHKTENINTRIDVIAINLSENAVFERLEYLKSAIFTE